MLGWLKPTATADHPLADARAAKSFVDGLAGQNASQALEALSDQLAGLRDAVGLKAQRGFEIVDLIDSAAKPFQRKLTQDFVATHAPSKAQETRTAHVMGGFWLRLADAYRLLLEMHESGDPSAQVLRPNLGTVAARALRAANLHLKWRLFRYSLVTPEFWMDVGRVYSIAESRGVASTTVVVYPGTWGESTVARELLKLLALSIASTDSLPPAQVEIAERVCAQFSEFFTLQKQAATGCHFWFDLTAAKAPARLADRLALSPSMRFFGPADAALEVEKLGAAIRQNDAVPTNMNLGGNYPIETVLATLRHLARYWAPQPPARKETRAVSHERIEIVHGLADVLVAVDGDVEDLEYDDGRLQIWDVTNESARGFGAVAPPGRADWLEIGALLGVKYEDGAAWGVGLVRRISLDNQGSRYVGIELLARGVTTVRLLPLLADGRVHPNDDLGTDALLLPSGADHSLGKLEITLLLKLGLHQPDRSFGMRMYSSNYLLLPKRVVEAGQDFDIVEFKVVQRG